ncbi:cysteine hydrolase family protein [Blastococcus capsensis]|uniref:cysteine hydrolase family protein n=1 Tax=Blastococcus capsensis TaxID=1564163 RepID=UPI00253FF064|nr:isochorismatase family cysteine hydrolase [Blastococcus capsensis]MDK3256015.1 isochorismatase family cysteine hydrolase [Blastococcus capsensis]
MGTPTPDDVFIAPHLESSALLVIDTQVDFLDGGASPIAGTTDRLPQMTRLVAAYRSARRPIVHVIRLYEGDDVDLVRRTTIQGGAPIVRPGSAGARIAPSLLPDPDVELDAAVLLAGGLQEVGSNEVVMWKPRWSAFYRTPLDDHLGNLGIDTVVLAGCNFPNCPRATIFDASERDYRVVVAQDATSQVTPDRLSDALQLGVCAMSTEAVVGELAATRGAPVAELRPAGAGRRVITSQEEVAELAAAGVRIDKRQFRADLDQVIDQGL